MIRKSPKPKKCGYSECGKTFIPQRSMQVVCSLPCSIKYNEKKEADKRHKEYKNNLTKLTICEDVARKVFQKWVRLRDELEPCISCNRTYTNQWDGGHYYKAETHSGLIFNEINVNKQCSECNGDNMHGNLIEYRKGLIKKYGEGKVQELDELSNSKRQYKFTREELSEIAIKYKDKIKNGDFT